jgi:hypothetical protein
MGHVSLSSGRGRCLLCLWSFIYVALLCVMLIALCLYVSSARTCESVALLVACLYIVFSFCRRALVILVRRLPSGT